MDEQIKQIAERLRGLRDALELSPEEVAYLEEPYTAHELVGPAARPGEKPLAGTTNPNAK